jgi:hypothetical protein
VHSERLHDELAEGFAGSSAFRFRLGPAGFDSVLSFWQDDSILSYREDNDEIEVEAERRVAACA